MYRFCLCVYVPPPPPAASCVIQPSADSSFATDLNHVLLQLVGTDIVNTLYKYKVSLRHLTFMIEILKLLMKSCAKFDLLFVNIQCATACSLEKVNFKVQSAVFVEPTQLYL